VKTARTATKKKTDDPHIITTTTTRVSHDSLTSHDVESSPINHQSWVWLLVVSAGAREGVPLDDTAFYYY
jgi:hypothetical protein